MSGIGGWVGGKAGESELAARIGRLGEQPGGQPLRARATLAAGVAAAALHGNASVEDSSGLLVAVTGRPRFDDAALAQQAEREGVAAAFAQAFLDRGRDLLPGVQGHFAVAVLRSDGSEALLAVDRCGCFPLFFAREGELLRFGSSPLWLPAGAEVDRQALYDYFFFHQVPAPRSVVRGQERLLPGEYLHVREVAVERGVYASTVYRGRRAPLEDLKREFRGLLRDAVGRAAGSAAAGAFLSGGTDSSTVAGTLTRILGRPAKTYSIGFAAEGYDEMEFARTAARHFGTDHHEYYVTPDDVLAAIPRIAAAHGNPFANESAVPTYFCARLAAGDGVTRMLAGDGGDEIFGGNERYASQRVFDVYGRVPRLFRALLEPLVARFPFGERIALVRKARSYLRQAKTRLPDRLYNYTLLRMLGAERVFEPSFLAGVDPEEPLRLAREVYDAADADSSLNRLLALDLKFTLADNDLVKVNGSCELAGVEVAYPLLDDAMVAFAARLPTDLKVKGYQLRWFFKWALADFLPEKIIRKRKHGFGLPFGVWLRTHRPLQELARECLAGLGGRGVVRPQFLAEILELHRTGHAGYYGVMIWTLMMLELWFRAHGERAGARQAEDRIRR